MQPFFISHTSALRICHIVLSSTFLHQHFTRWQMPMEYAHFHGIIVTKHTIKREMFCCLKITRHSTICVSTYDHLWRHKTCLQVWKTLLVPHVIHRNDHHYKHSLTLHIWSCPYMSSQTVVLLESPANLSTSCKGSTTNCYKYCNNCPKEQTAPHTQL
jgi:hypothetical protein